MNKLAHISRLGLKELTSLRHDSVLLVFLLYAFSVAIYMPAKGSIMGVHNASVAIVDEDRSALSRKLADALLPAAGYLVLHVLESQLFTPLVLGRTMRINPLAIILWLLVWGWLWGVAGLLVAVPMLVCLKIVAERLEGGAPWARLLE